MIENDRKLSRVALARLEALGLLIMRDCHGFGQKLDLVLC